MHRLRQGYEVPANGDTDRTGVSTMPLYKVQLMVVVEADIVDEAWNDAKQAFVDSEAWGAEQEEQPAKEAGDA